MVRSDQDKGDRIDLGRIPYPQGLVEVCVRVLGCVCTLQHARSISINLALG